MSTSEEKSFADLPNGRKSDDSQPTESTVMVLVITRLWDAFIRNKNVRREEKSERENLMIPRIIKRCLGENYKTLLSHFDWDRIKNLRAIGVYSFLRSQVSCMGDLGRIACVPLWAIHHFGYVPKIANIVITKTFSWAGEWNKKLHTSFKTRRVLWCWAMSDGWIYAVVINLPRGNFPKRSPTGINVCLVNVIPAAWVPKCSPTGINNFLGTPHQEQKSPDRIDRRQSRVLNTRSLVAILIPSWLFSYNIQDIMRVGDLMKIMP